MPTAAMAVPLAMRARTPMQPITRGTSPAATIMITVAGTNAAPAFSGW
jgi:hypothetical protein